MTDQERIAGLETEVAILRAALLPFAYRALTREARDAPDGTQVTVWMADCKVAQKALVADSGPSIGDVTIEPIKKAIFDRIKTLESNRFTDDWDESSEAHVSGLKDALRIINETVS